MNCCEQYERDKNYQKILDMHAEIERLRARVAELEGLLSTLSAEADRYDPPEGDDDHLAWDSRLTIGHLRKARAALEANP
jgi:hypothetical protein